MKRFFFVVLVVLILASCETKPKGERLVLDYLQQNTNGLDCSIIKISSPDSLYSPFELINSLILTKTRTCADLTKQLVDAYDKPTLKERRAAALEVAKLADAEYNNRDDFVDIVNAITNPSIVDKPANRIAYTATYKVQGAIKEDVFFLERDGSAVGHTASELEDSYLKLCDVNGKLFVLKRDAEETVRTIR